jgi:hypothetical protein
MVSRKGVSKCKRQANTVVHTEGDTRAEKESSLLKIKVMLLAGVVTAVFSAPAYAQEGPERVTICHKPGTPAQQTKEVPEQAVPGHLGHGDTLGACEGEPGPEPEPEPEPNPGNDGKDGKNGKDGANGNGGDTFAPVLDLTQDLEQEASSGDVSQSTEIVNTGDNSNQCANVQNVANTGNAQNQGAVMGGGEDGEFEGNSSIEVNPENSTSCNQSVNQYAVAVDYL